MSKFNETRKDSTITKNYEGAKAYKHDSKIELVTAVTTSMLSDIHYEKADGRLNRIKKLVVEISKTDPTFIAKLASYTRNKMYLRTTPVVLLGELAKNHNGDNLVRRAVNATVQRADEMAEILAYYKHANGNLKLSKQLMKGIADCFYKFDEYQFSKYKGNNKNISLRDAMFLTHPKARNEAERSLFKKIANNDLSVPETWETKISDTGSEGTSKTEAWEDLIKNRKIGYMATIRNLRNFIKSEISKDAMIQVAEYISNEKAVINSKQLPFRFLSAYKMLVQEGIAKNHIFLKALEQAMNVSAQNILGFNKNDSVLIATDVSGSMSSNLSSNGSIRMKDVGMVLANVLNNHLNFCDVGLFGDKWVLMDNLTHNAVLSNCNKMERLEYEVGYSTNGWKAINWANKLGKKYDKVVFFTDCQLYNNNIYSNGSLEREWKKYRKNNPNAKMILFDLSGYGNTPIKVNEDNVIMVSGWSDKIFDVLSMIEDGSKLVEVIEQEVI